MSKAAVFTMKLGPDLRAEFMAAAETNHRPASQLVRELMREFDQCEQGRRDHAVIMRDKVEMARVSVRAGHCRPHEKVEVGFAARRSRIIDQAETV